MGGKRNLFALMLKVICKSYLAELSARLIELPVKLLALPTRTARQSYLPCRKLAKVAPRIREKMPRTIAVMAAKSIRT